MPLVFLNNPVFSHLQLEWQIPVVRTWYEQLFQRWKTVRYDWRGTGLSDRNIDRNSLDVAVSDLGAVVDAMELGEFALFGSFHWGATAIAYAARHPERVSHLILFGAYARNSDVITNQDILAAHQMIDSNWEVFSETLGGVMYGWSDNSDRRQVATMIRESITPDAYKTIRAAIRSADVTHLLAQVSVPTLIIHPRESASVQMSVSRELVSSISDARLVVVEGQHAAPARCDTGAITRAMEEFFEETSARREPASSTGDTHTILFTDIQSSTALAQRLGDAKAQEVRRSHNDIVRSALRANGGNEIKHTGDGIMASFSTASAALDCAIAIQQGVAAHKEQHPDSPLGVYVGLNAGEPIAEDDDLFGTSVDLAARLVDHAQPGQILAADVVRQLAAGKQFLFSDLGETALRGFEDPVKLWELRWQEPP